MPGLEESSAFWATNAAIAKRLNPKELSQLGLERNPRLEQELRDSIRSKMFEYRSKFELLKEFAANHSDDDERLIINSVEDVICEQTSWALRLTGVEGEFSTDLSIEFLASRWLLGAALIRAVPYLWPHEIFSVVATTPLPRHTIQVQLPFPELWFTFQSGYPTRSGSDDLADGMVVMEVPALPGINKPQRMRIAVLGSNTETQVPFCCPIDIFHGQIYPDDFESNGIELVTQFLNCLSFINSPYIVIEQRGLCRQVRRRLEIAPEDSSKVHFVILRAPLVKHDYEASESDVDWKYRWIVRGHHRAQWCPSTQSHKLMWIAPYIKGPEDKPLKPRTYKVIR